VTERDVAWADEETTPTHATITETCRCGTTRTSHGDTYEQAHQARLTGRRGHQCDRRRK
jgi:hypothetical protein